MTQNADPKTRSQTPWDQPEILLLFLFLAGVCLLFTPRPSSDGAYYYEMVRSLVFDHDLNFFNERMFHTYRYVPLLVNYLPGEWTPTGYPPNIFTIGPALYWLIPYAALNLVSSITGGSATGYELSYRLIPGIMSVLQGFISLLIIYRLALRFCERRHAFPALVLVAFASNFPAFVFVTPVFSHISSLFTVCIFIWLWWFSADARAQSWRFYALYGAIGGLAAVMRVQNAFFMILPAVDGIQRAFKGRLKQTLVWNGVLALAFLVFYTPQMAMSLTLYGQAFVDPQGHGGMLWSNPRFRVILFDGLKGLFVVNPVYLAASLGIPFLLWKNRRLGLGVVLATGIQFYINAVRRDPFGVGFGMRRFIECLPFFILGLSVMLELLSRIPKLRLIVLSLLTLLVPWNYLLMAQYYYSDLGAPWIQMSFGQMMTRQFTLAPQLLARLIGENLILTSLLGDLRSYLFTLGFLFVIGAALTSAASVYRASRERVTTLLLKPQFLGALMVFIVLVNASLLHFHRATRTLYLLDFSASHFLAGPQVLQLRTTAPYCGVIGGLRFAADSISWIKTKTEYNPQVFLQEGVVTWTQNRVAGPSQPIEFGVRAPFPVKTLEIVSYFEASPMILGDEIARVTIYKAQGGIETLTLKAGEQTSQGAAPSQPAKLQAPLKVAGVIAEHPDGPRWSYWYPYRLEQPGVIDRIHVESVRKDAIFVLCGLALEPYNMQQLRQ